MVAYVVRRSVAGLLLLIVMSIVTFALFFASPINPADFACGKNCSEAQKQETAAALGYDDNFLEQWVDFAKGVFVGRDFPDDPALKETAPETIVHCAAPCLGYSQRAHRDGHRPDQGRPCRSRCRSRSSPSRSGSSAASLPG